MMVGMADNIVTFPLSDLARYRKQTREPQPKIANDQMTEAHRLLDDVDPDHAKPEPNTRN